MSQLPATAVRRGDLAAVRRRALRTRAYPADRGPRTVRLWLPLTPLFALLAPFALLLAPLGYLAPPRYRPDPILAVLALGVLLLSLSGTDIAVDSPQARVRIKIL